MNLIRIAATTCLVLAVALPADTSAQSWRDSLKTQLVGVIAPTSSSLDRLRITRPGTLLEVQRDGISGSPGADGTILTTRLREGRIEQARGLVASLANKNSNRDFRLGEKVYVLDVDVNDNNIRFLLLTLETNQITVAGSTRQTRYKAMLEIDFPKDSLKTYEFGRVMELVTTVLRPEGMQEEPKTIEIGQTIAEVEAVMGKPESILKVATKTIYVYKSIKVTFVEGKVTDIQ